MERARRKETDSESVKLGLSRSAMLAEANDSNESIVESEEVSRDSECSSSSSISGRTM
ncbi:hypothetical protein F2Q69_00060604 [Brassica cretica]|uniref:Uncharacterized protein n=1 Tax=Brassica cretica TaxID=69181 RepID=A0A8S9RF22_BRACR|nr:hypothetical protein F2Q69_00060604 [Brassica cretica]